METNWQVNLTEGRYSLVLEEQFLPIIEMTQRLAAMNHIPATERLIQYIQSIITIQQENPLLTQLIHYELMNPIACGGDTGHIYVSQLLQLIQDILRDGVASDEFRPNLNMDCAVVFLVGITDVHFMIKPFLKDLSIGSAQFNETYFAQAMTMFLHGIIRRKEDE